MDMKPMVTNKQALIWLNIYPIDGKSNKMKKQLCFILFILNVLMHIITITGSFAFFLKFVKIDFEVSLFGFYQFIVLLTILYVLIVAFILRFKIEKIFNNLSEIYNACKYTIISLFVKH